MLTFTRFAAPRSSGTSRKREGNEDLVIKPVQLYIFTIQQITSSLCKPSNMYVQPAELTAPLELQLLFRKTVVSKTCEGQKTHCETKNAPSVLWMLYLLLYFAPSLCLSAYQAWVRSRVFLLHRHNAVARGECGVSDETTIDGLSLFHTPSVMRWDVLTDLTWPSSNESKYTYIKNSTFWEIFSGHRGLLDMSDMSIWYICCELGYMSVSLNVWLWWTRFVT